VSFSNYAEFYYQLNNDEAKTVYKIN